MSKPIRNSKNLVDSLRYCYSLGMHLLVTGLSGTLAPRLAQSAKVLGWDVSGWDRKAVPADDSTQAQAELDRLQPDAIAHLAIGSSAWAGLLARHAHQFGLPFLFTSTAMVFDKDPDGPHDVASERNARDEYGRGKIACEDVILGACQHASIARLGWQIDLDPAGNNMLAELDRWQARDGQILASARWKPACSFIDDTCTTLLHLIAQRHAGIVHLDSNAQEGWRFDQIVRALRTYASRDWRVQTDETMGAYTHDQRLVGGEVKLPALSTLLAFDA
jgi:dTDP-4-dehydrorhamnose reductase